MANFFTCLSCGLWDVEVPEGVQAIAEAPDDGEFHKNFSHDDLKLGFQYFADMLNRMAFFVLNLVLLITFCATFVQTWVIHGQDG